MIYTVKGLAHVKQNYRRMVLFVNHTKYHVGGLNHRGFGGVSYFCFRFVSKTNGLENVDFDHSSTRGWTWTQLE